MEHTPNNITALLIVLVQVYCWGVREENLIIIISLLTNLDCTALKSLTPSPFPFLVYITILR